MRQHIVWTLLIVMLAGCGPSAAWYQRDVTVEKAAADCRACVLRTRAESTAAHFNETRDSHITGAPATPTELRDMNREQDFNNCMRGKGYRLTKGQWLPKDIKRCRVETCDDYYTTVAGK